MPVGTAKKESLALPFLVVLLAGVSVSFWRAVRLAAQESFHGGWTPSLWVSASPRPIWVALLLWLVLPLAAALFAGRERRGAVYADVLRLVGLSSLPIAIGTTCLAVLGAWAAASRFGLALWWASWPSMWLIAYLHAKRNAHLSRPIAVAVAMVLTLGALALLLYMEVRPLVMWLELAGANS